MKRALSIGILLWLAGCTNGDGERCNPLRATTDCDPGLSCVYPTAPMCGVSFCCKVDGNGNIVDRNANCQPDPTAAAQCMLDFATMPMDAGTD